MGTGRRSKTSLSKFEKRGQHPAFIGEILFQRYVLHSKIERNRFCSKWLAFDSKTEKFVRVIIFREGKHYIMQGLKQLRVLQFIQKTGRSRDWIHKLNFYRQNLYSLQTQVTPETFCTGYYNCFIHNGTFGRHFCLVQEYNQFTLKDLLSEKLKIPHLKDHILTLTTQIVVALNFLHFECDVIHGDLNPKNIRLKLPESLSRVFIARKLMKSNLEASRRAVWNIWRNKKYNDWPSSLNDLDSSKESFERRDSPHFEVNSYNRHDLKFHHFGQYNFLDIKNSEIDRRKNRSKSMNINLKSKKKSKRNIKKVKCDFELLKIKQNKKDYWRDFQEFEINLNFLMNFAKEEKGRLIKAERKQLIKEILFPQKLKNFSPQKLKIRIDGLANAKFKDEIKSKLPSTRDFKAPERIFKKPITPKSDIWSLGCIIYKLINEKDIFHTKIDPYFGSNENFESESTQDSIGTQDKFNQPAKVKKYKFVGEKMENLVGDEEVRQAIMIHCKIQTIPSFLWKAAPIQNFLHFRINRFIRNEQMESDILDSYCNRKFDKNSKACQETGRKFFKIEKNRKSTLKSLLFGHNTLESFLKITENLNRVFYKDFARVSRKYRIKPRSRRSSRKSKQYLERNILSKILHLSLQTNASSRPSSRDLFLLLFKFLFLQRIMDPKNYHFNKKNASDNGVGYDLFVSRLKSYLGFPLNLNPHQLRKQVFPEEAEKLLLRLSRKDILDQKKGVLAEIDTEAQTPCNEKYDGMWMSSKIRPIFITSEKEWERKEKLFLKKFQGTEIEINGDFFDLKRYYKHVYAKDSDSKHNNLVSYSH